MVEAMEVNEEPQNSEREENKEKKKAKRGIIYLSSIPPYMNVTKIREIFGQFGTLGRVYLQLADKETKSGEKKSKRRNVAHLFTEGWVEFERKSTAKKVALSLNNKQVSTRKKSKHYDVIWNIKYLSNFKWTHLNERLAYERAARKQKLRAEVQLAKKKTNFFTMNLDKHKKKKKGDNREGYVNRALEGLNGVKHEGEDGEGVEVGEEREGFLKGLFN